jgi:hypothetical protein
VACHCSSSFSYPRSKGEITSFATITWRDIFSHLLRRCSEAMNDSFYHHKVAHVSRKSLLVEHDLLLA